MDLREHMDGQLVRYLVSRAITCPVTGAVLDVRTCHVFRDADGDPVAAIAPGAYAELDGDALKRVADAGWVLDTREVKA